MRWRHLFGSLRRARIPSIAEVTVSHRAKFGARLNSSESLPEQNRIQRETPSEPELPPRIQDFIQSLRPTIKDIIGGQSRLGVWKPGGNPDDETTQFYRDLAIPLVRNKPNLLLHNLGTASGTTPNPHVERIFMPGNHRILWQTSGSGKTRLLFEGLCQHWGFYFVGSVDPNGARIGSTDLQSAIDLMGNSPGWIANIFQDPAPHSVQAAHETNEAIANVRVRSVLLARWIIFRTFIQVAREEHSGRLPDTIKRDWLLCQALPLDFWRGRDPFVELIDSCLVEMTAFERSMCLRRLANPAEILGSAFDNSRQSFFYVLDEAQETGKQHMTSFSTGNGTTRQPVLQPIIRNMVLGAGTPANAIVSGTGFSMDLFQDILRSGVGKPSWWDVIHTTGDFSDKQMQKDYIARYLPPSCLHSKSGTSLLSRIFRWLRGRHRFTSSYLERLLNGPWEGGLPSSPHKLLDAFIHVFTDVWPIDGDNTILSQEPDAITPNVEAFPWDRIERDPEFLKELARCMFTFSVRRQYPTAYKTRTSFVEYGLARFDKGNEASIREPLAFVSIVRYLEKKHSKLYRNIRRRRRILEPEEPSAKDVEFESLVLLSISQLFRPGKALEDVFEFVGPTPDWARQKAQIVTRLENGTLGVFDLADGEPEIPSAVYAGCPDDVRRWIESMHTGWCIPSRSMGPDLLTRMRLADGRLLLVAFQTKCHVNGELDSLKSSCTAEAIQQLNVNNFFQTSPNEDVRQMLDAIHSPKDSFTGARYNLLRVIVAYPQDAVLRRHSKAVKGALGEDKHPIATMKNVSLTVSLSWDTTLFPILSSLDQNLTEANERLGVPDSVDSTGL